MSLISILLLLTPFCSLGLTFAQTRPECPTTWGCNSTTSLITLVIRRSGTRFPRRRPRCGILRMQFVSLAAFVGDLLTPNQSSALPSLNQGFDNRYSIDASSTQDSRRSSIDSRVHGGMSSLALSGPTSPYELSQNPSRTSLVSNLQQQRGITNPDQRPNGTSPLSPMGSRPSWSSARPSHQPRRAPVINPNPRSVSGAPDPMAASPTKGFAWAFPGHDGLENEHPAERRGSSSGRSSTERTMSRQNSYATSINSSIYTVDSNLPNGQRRFIKEEGTHSFHF